MVNSRNSNYRVMRLILFYDLPTTTKKDVKEATEFRKKIINKGFLSMQESVYIKQCINHDSVNRTLIYIDKILPNNGDIRIIAVTEKQYMDMKILKGEKSMDEKLSEKGSLIII